MDATKLLDVSCFQHDRRFSRNNALVMATLCALSYYAPEDQMEWAKNQPAVQSLHFLDVPATGTQVSVIETEKALMIAPRGTPLTLDRSPGVALQGQDLLNDLNAWPVQNYDGSARIHAGFKNAADGVWEQLKPFLEQARAGHKAIHLAGHSLGAAIATNLADRMHHELGALPETLTTLGAPDVGWSGERRHLQEIGLEERTLRFVNNIDPVPGAVPFGQPLGQTVYFDHQGEAQLGEQAHTLDRLKGLAQAVRSLDFNPLQDHFPLEYRRLIGRKSNAALLDGLSQP
ncbi:MAG: lipase family protein [Candidatus Eremiobacteraeota bacterium]|nr:lipase family protein [Candidatus Eremiobacteraeota bacterium]